MATETGPDLTFARQQVERLMDDTCDILRPSTLEAASIEAAPVIHAGVKCLVGDLAAQGSNSDLDAYRFAMQASLPAATTGVEEGDVLRVTSSRRDPELVGMLYVIDKVSVKTMLVTRRVEMTRLESAIRDQHEDTDPGVWSPSP